MPRFEFNIHDTSIEDLLNQFVTRGDGLALLVGEQQPDAVVSDWDRVNDHFSEMISIWEQIVDRIPHALDIEKQWMAVLGDMLLNIMEEYRWEQSLDRKPNRKLIYHWIFIYDQIYPKIRDGCKSLMKGPKEDPKSVIMAPVYASPMFWDEDPWNTGASDSYPYHYAEHSECSETQEPVMEDVYGPDDDMWL